MSDIDIVRNTDVAFEQKMAEAINNQYKVVNSLTMEVVRFGMMLLAVEEYLLETTPISFKCWLAENCPGVNYKTAQRHKQLATAIREKCALPASGALIYNALEASDEAVVGKVEEVISGSSARQLLLDFKVKDAPVKPVGRPEGTTKAVAPAVSRDQVRKMALDELFGITSAVEQFFRFDKDLLIDDPIAKQMAVQAFRHAIDRLTVR